MPWCARVLYRRDCAVPVEWSRVEGRWGNFCLGPKPLAVYIHTDTHTRALVRALWFMWFIAVIHNAQCDRHRHRHRRRRRRRQTDDLVTTTPLRLLVVVVISSSSWWSSSLLLLLLTTANIMYTYIIYRGVVSRHSPRRPYHVHVLYGKDKA